MTFNFKGRERMIFALIAGMLFLLAKAVFPDLPFSEEQSTLFMGMIGAYILGEGLSGKTVSDNVLKTLNSHKFQSLAVGLIAIILKVAFPDWELSDADLTRLIATLGTLIVGVGIEKNPQP